MIPHLARLIDARIEPDVVTLDRKPLLKQECGKWAKALLNGGCRRVVVLWDLLPAWGEYEGRGCRHDDKEEISESLRLAGVRSRDPRVALVCVEKMLESWILSDNHALSAFLSTPAHQVRVPRCNRPDDIRDPKAVLNRYFGETRYRKYRDLEHAGRIIRTAQLNHLRRSQSFCRFEGKLTT
ncbi:MAG: DUF4276 family protein [Candidatus Hydrogenedentes bacterium]|nr:DUF4276 family protein [Candidatus Hydrogenedentota bacterium]